MENCQEKIIHKESVDRATAALPEELTMQRLSDMFKALSDPTRLKIVISLGINELCVCDLSVLCNLSESAISHQLRLLRSLRIVKNRRHGKIVYYSLDDSHVHSLIDQTIEHVKEQK